MFKYLKASFRRKIARRFTKEYPPVLETFHFNEYGTIQFANWSNPLVGKQQLSEPMVFFFKQFIKPGDLVIDIGANIGDTTVPMALCAGKEGLTLGFDPNPFVFKILQKNASLNKDKTNIVPVRCAVTDKEEEFYFISSEASFSNGGISPTKESNHGRFIYHEKIKGVPLKQFLEEQYKEKVAKLSFIKIDTEGYDKEIIKSISDLIQTYRPVVVAESFGKATPEHKRELYDVISKLGYDIFYFADFDTRAEVKQLKHRDDIVQYRHTINIYARPSK